MNEPTHWSSFLRGGNARLHFVLLTLAVGWAGQNVLARYVESVRAEQVAELRKPLAEFPQTLAGWTGHASEPKEGIIDALRPDDWLQRLYVHPSGQQVVLWINFSKSSDDQYHYPTVCMTGSGWVEEEAQRRQVPLAEGAGPTVAAGPTDGSAPRPAAAGEALRLCFSKPQRTEYVYYWYYLIGESPIDRAMRGFSRYARAFLRGRNNASVTLEIFSQSANPDPERIDAFLHAVAAELEGFMPEGTLVASQLGSNY